MIHIKLYAQVFLKRINQTDNFFCSDWWKYSDITKQSHVMVQPAAVGTPSAGVAGCARCSWSQVSLLSCYSWHPSGMLLCLDTYRDTYCIVTSVSRYESYREAPASLHPYLADCSCGCKMAQNLYQLVNVIYKYWAVTCIHSTASKKIYLQISFVIRHLTRRHVQSPHYPFVTGSK